MLESYSVITDRAIIVGLIAFICGLGLIKLLRRRKRLSEESTFAIECIQKLRTYIDSRGDNYESYNWLIHRSNKLQTQLGTAGIYATYRPPYANFQYSNYPVILNMLPELRSALIDPILANSQLIFQYANALQDVLIRHLGNLHDLDEHNNKSVRNPITWLREGIRQIIALPLTLLYWCGALSQSTVSRLTTGRTFGIISAFAAVLSFISAVMGIMLGWTQFTDKVIELWTRVF